MEFGKVDPQALPNINFSLPPDAIGTYKVLKQNINKNKVEVYVGCAKWGRKDWIGKVYPPKTKEADFLKLYSINFKCVELNATYYKIPNELQVASWRSKVGKDFKFFPKFVEVISHDKKLKDVGELTERFLKGISGFENNLGASFIMPSPYMGPKDIKAIESFIQSVPKEFNLFVELRNTQWYANKKSFSEVFEMFEDNQVGSIITDSSGRRDCLHMRLTKPEAFIRFVGNGLHPTDYTRVDDWVQRIKSWIEMGIQKIYFFMHQHEEIYSPELCLYVIQQLNKHCGTQIPEPKFYSGDDTPLFQ